jgi:hypothetical protein
MDTLVVKEIAKSTILGRLFSIVHKDRYLKEQIMLIKIRKLFVIKCSMLNLLRIV